MGVALDSYNVGVARQPPPKTLPEGGEKGKGVGLDEGLRQGAPAQKGRGRMRGIRAGWSGCAAPEVVITCELQSPSCQLNYQMCVSAPINNDQGNSKNNSMPLMLLSFYFVLNVYPKEQLN